jgi:hypothetical protein
VLVKPRQITHNSFYFSGWVGMERCHKNKTHNNLPSGALKQHHSPHSHKTTGRHWLASFLFFDDHILGK